MGRCRFREEHADGDRRGGRDEELRKPHRPHDRRLPRPSSSPTRRRQPEALRHSQPDRKRQEIARHRLPPPGISAFHPPRPSLLLRHDLYKVWRRHPDRQSLARPQGRWRARNACLWTPLRRTQFRRHQEGPLLRSPRHLILRQRLVMIRGFVWCATPYRCANRLLGDSAGTYCSHSNPSRFTLQHFSKQVCRISVGG